MLRNPVYITPSHAIRHLRFTRGDMVASHLLAGIRSIGLCDYLSFAASRIAKNVVQDGNATVFGRQWLRVKETPSPHDTSWV